MSGAVAAAIHTRTATISRGKTTNLAGILLKDPDASVQYHTGSMKGIEQSYANRPIVIEAYIASVERALKG